MLHSLQLVPHFRASTQVNKTGKNLQTASSYRIRRKEKTEKTEFCQKARIAVPDESVTFNT